jgi:IS5 family transposase
VLQRYANHFLVQLERLIDWEAVSKQLLRMYKGRGRVGRPPYPPVLVFKMLFLAYLYNVSERAVEEMADVHLLAKWFLGLAIDEQPPDHSTLTAFKARLLKGNNWLILQELFDEVIRTAQAHGLEFGELQLLDSVHTQADVNNAKERERQESGQLPRDPGATVVHKGRRRVVGPDGRATVQEITFNGYKTHTAQNAATGLVTSVHATKGNAADNKAFPALREHDRELGLPVRAYGGDKAYDDTDIYARLDEEGLESAIALRRQRTQKKDRNKEGWLQMEADPTYQQRRGQRYRVEQPFGDVKHWHGFERCRYLGLARYRIQALLTFMVRNCKRMVKLLTGITFRPQAKGRRAEPVTPVIAIGA